MKKNARNTPPRMLLLAALLLIVNLSQAQCPVILEGTHSMCSTKYDYYIANFSSAATYQAFAVVNGTTTSNFTISNTGTFFASLPIGTMQAMVIIKITSPCQSADTIWLQPCCGQDPPNTTIVTDIKTSQIPNIVHTQNYVYDPSIYSNQPAGIVVHGELEITDVTEFYNTTFYMDQGASFRVKNQKELVFINCTVQAYCNYMWEGIICENGSKFKIRDNSIIRDAQYGLKCSGNVIFDMYNNIRFINNYAGVYFQPNANGNSILLSTLSTTQDITISWNGTNLLSNFYGQNPVAQNRSYAGFLIYDMANFNNAPGSAQLGITINNTTLGIAAFNSNITLPRNVTISNLVATTGQYTSTSNYNGTAIYSEASTAAPKTLTIGTNTTLNALIQNCRYGIFVNNNMNLTCKYNRIQNTSDMGAVRVINCPSRTINISWNTINLGYWVGIHCQSIANSSLTIFQNTLNNGANYKSAGTNLGNTAIYVTNKALSIINGTIANNTINNSRVGIDVSNVQGAGATNKFLIATNSINVTRANNQLIDGISSLTWIHYGIKLSGIANLQASDNVITRTVAVPSTSVVPGYTNIINGIETNLTGSNTIIKNNTLKDFGTFVNVIGNCQGTSFQCNTCSLTVVNSSNNTNTRGYYFKAAQLGNQGSLTIPSDNKWIGWGLSVLPNRLTGAVSNSFTWFHRNASNIYYATPAAVSGGLTINSTATGQGSCSNVNPDAIDLRDLITKIINDEMEYEFFPEESRYQDLLWAFTILNNDADLRASDAAFEEFYRLMQDENASEFNQIYQFLNDEDYADAMSVLNSMIENNSIDYNLAYTLEIAALMADNPDYELNQDQLDEISRIAYLTVWEGGAGVINARSILNLEVIDQLPYLRSATKPKTENRRMVTVQHLLKECPFANIQVYDRSGKKVYAGTVTGFDMMRNNLRSGIYTYSVIKEEQALTGKWSFNK